MDYLVLGTLALLASTVAAVTGTGGGILLLPVMVSIFGIREAVPMYAVAQMIGNASRVTLNRHSIDLHVVAWFVAGAVPAAVVGSLLFAWMSVEYLTRALGLFLIVSAVIRRHIAHKMHHFRRPWFAVLGATFGSVSALLGSAGPFLAPFFLGYGLVKAQFIGTEALGTLVMHITKLSTYGVTGTLTPTAVVVGVALAPLMIAGAWLGRTLVNRISTEYFKVLIDTVVCLFGVLFLFS